MSLILLSRPSLDLRAKLILGVPAAILVLLAVLLRTWAATAFIGCMLASIAWIAAFSGSRKVLLDAAHRRVIVRWRSALFVRREVELPLERFRYVVSYHPLGNPPSVCVALMEVSADRALDLAQFPAAYQRRGLWSNLKLVEGEDAKQLRASLATRVGIPDGGYKGFYPGLWPSEKAI